MINFGPNYYPIWEKGSVPSVEEWQLIFSNKLDNNRLDIELPQYLKDYVTNDALASALQNQSNRLSGTTGLTPGDVQGIGLHTRGSDNAVLYGDPKNGWRQLALASDVQNEIAARENAINAEQQARQNGDSALESTKVSRAGDTMSGDLAFPSVLDQGSYSGSAVKFTTNSSPLQANFQLHGSPGQAGLSLNLTDEQGATQRWVFGENGVVSTPHSGSLLEIMGSGGPLAMFTWTCRAKNKDWVPFPRSFSDIPVNLQLTPEHYPDSDPSVIATYYSPTLTPQGFKLDLRWIGSGSGGEDTPRIINIMAVGAI